MKYPLPVARSEPHWTDKDTNLLPKILTQNMSCLQEIKGESWSRDYWNGHPLTDPN